MTMRETGWAMTQTTGSAEAKLVLIMLSDIGAWARMSNTRRASVESLARLCEMPEDRVRVALRLLHDQGLFRHFSTEEDAPVFEFELATD